GDQELALPFFDRFTAGKGLAVLLLWPSVLFWRQLLADYHEALDFLHPFTSVAVAHLALGALFLILFVPLMFWLALRPKARESDRKILQTMRQHALPALLWVRPFFQDVGADRWGRVVAAFVGGSYLIFFYMTLGSLASPAAVTTTTAGSTVEAHDVHYVWGGRSGTHRGSYCVLDVRAND